MSRRWLTRNPLKRLRGLYVEHEVKQLSKFVLKLLKQGKRIRAWKEER